MKVFVYWNLHKGLWSVRALEGPDKGRVIARAHTVVLQGASPKVSEAGRQRVLREQRKNVHAGIVGTLVSTGPAPECFKPWGHPVTYNPYKGPAFVYKDTGETFTGAHTATLHNKGVFVR